MAQRKFVVKGVGEDARVTFTLEAHRGKIWITSFNCPFAVEAIFMPSQADSFIDLINQATKEARGYEPGSPS